MDAVLLARIQFAMTAGFHFLFPPITMGLAFLLVIIETLRWRTGKEVYLQMSDFWLKILAVNFVVGVACVVMLAAYVIKAWGWQRLFRKEQRPAVLTLAAAGGAMRVDMLQTLDVPRSTLNTLVKRGLIQIKEEPAEFHVSRVKARPFHFEFSAPQKQALAKIDEGVASHDFAGMLLHGVTGSGKTAVGEKAAALAGCGFFDLDVLIVEHAGMPITQIFKEHGESGFRELETAVLEQFLESAGPCILATGGGALLSEVNTALCRRYGEIVLLDIPFEVCYRRIQNDTSRPIAASRSEEELLALYESRRSLYIQHSDHVLIDSPLAKQARKVASIFTSLAAATLRSTPEDLQQ